MNAIAEYLRRNRHLISDYFVVKQSYDRLVFYFATVHSPSEFDRSDIIPLLANDDTQICNLNPLEFNKIRTALGV